jgi:hypothetical protein
MNQKSIRLNSGGDFQLVKLAMNLVMIYPRMFLKRILIKNMILMKIIIGKMSMILTKNMIGVMGMILMRNMIGVMSMIPTRNMIGVMSMILMRIMTGEKILGIKRNLHLRKNPNPRKILLKPKKIQMMKKKKSLRQMKNIMRIKRALLQSQYQKIHLLKLNKK